MLACIPMPWSFYHFFVWLLWPNARGDTHMTFNLRGWVIASVLDIQFFFLIKENWVCAMTRHHAVPSINILMTRCLPFESDVRWWSHSLMILWLPLMAIFWIMFSFNWLVIIWRGCSFKIGRPRSRVERILGVDGQG